MKGNGRVKRSVQKEALARMNGRKMNNYAIYCALLCFWSCQNFVHSTDWVDDLMYSIVNNSEFHQVKIMTRLSEGEFLENPLIDELFMKVMENLPTMRINFDEDFKLPANSVPDETPGAEDSNGTAIITGNLSPPIDTSATLFTLVIESRDGLPILMTKNFINAVAKMATYHYTAKYLLVSFVREPSLHVEILLDHAWTNNILDFTIIELAEPQVPRRSILIHRPIVSPDIYQLNPFKKEYTKNNSTVLRNDLFPDKDTNFWGHRLKPSIWYLNAQGSLLLENTGNHITATFNQKFNISVPLKTRPSRLVLKTGPQLYADFAKYHGELSHEIFPYFFVGWNDTRRTSTVVMDQFCFVVPIIRSTESTASVNFFMVFLVTFSIILIFWMFMHLLGVKSYSWRMFNIGRVLFGISVAQKPRDTVGRIIFTCLLVVFAINSSTIYSSITEITLNTETEMQFESFEDLDRSGLPIIMTETDFDKIRNLYDDFGPLKNFANKTVIEKTSMYLCIDKLYTGGKVACLMNKMHVPKHGLIFRVFKIANPCLWNDPLTFVVGERSPYRSRLDKLIMRMQSAGISNKPDRFDVLNSLDEKINPRTTKQEPTPLYRQLIVMSIIGYSLSIVAFFAEIIIHRVSMYRKRKARLVRPFPKSNRIHL